MIHIWFAQIYTWDITLPIEYEFMNEGECLRHLGSVVLNLLSQLSVTTVKTNPISINAYNTNDEHTLSHVQLHGHMYF